MMSVFDKEPSSTARGKPDKSYNLTNGSVRNAEGLHRCGFTIEVPHPSKKGKMQQIHFAANDATELKDWMGTIKECAKDVEVTKKEEQQKKVPGRWDPPANTNNKGPSGGVKEKPQVVATPQTAPPQAQAQPQYAPPQQYSQAQPQYAPPQQYGQPQYQQQYAPQPQYQQPQPQYNQQYYSPPPQQYGYQQPQPQYQQQYQQPQYQQQYQPQYQQPQPQYQQAPPAQPKYQDLFANAPSAPTNEPTQFPSVPQEQPKSQSSMFPNLKTLGN